jgi:hypothetical protein
MRQRVDVERSRDLAGEPGDHPCANRVRVEIHISYPDNASRGLLTQELDRAYLDALTDIHAQAVAA